MKGAAIKATAVPVATVAKNTGTAKKPSQKMVNPIGMVINQNPGETGRRSAALNTRIEQSVANP